METVTLQTESYLFQSAGQPFRAIPFYELSIMERVIFENGSPKYLLDFDRRAKPLVQDFYARMNRGEELEEMIQKLGRFLGRKWTIHHNIEGEEVPGSQQTEKVTLVFLDNLADLFMDVYFVATNTIDTDILLDESRFIKTFVDDVEEPAFEAAYAENEEDLNRMLTFIFRHRVELNKLVSSDSREVYDLSPFKQSCITLEELERDYPRWIEESGRSNTMTQYGIIMSVVSYINRNSGKRHLVMVTEKRKHWQLLLFN